jgi:hypothetical protein
MDTMRPDERAAGVISGSDPYRELELYLEKVSVSTDGPCDITALPGARSPAWSCG